MNRRLLETRHGYMHVRTTEGASGTPLALLHMTPQSSGSSCGSQAC